LATFKKIFQSYYAPLCNYAFRIVKDESTAEEIVQNLFIELWEKDALTNVKNKEHYLLRSVKFKCIDHLRARKQNKEVPLSDLPEKSVFEPGGLTEEDIVPLLHYFASKLPPKTREVFLLSRTSGMSYKEIASEMGISVKTVENQMGRALKNMKTLLKDNRLLYILLIIKIFQ
jgi:RNA polymerase sigma-70 factor (ECF subfamily)